jgi:putative membrane-bound dehydrogenase-like protein
MRNSHILFVAISCLFWSCQSNQYTDLQFDLLPEEEKHLLENALSSFTVADGLGVEFFATEPMMINPTNLDVDHLGRVWVIEARNYRLVYNPAHEKRQEGDRILILEDTNQDGKADKSQVFYQGNDINAALGIGVFGNKVIVSTSPNILVFTDEDLDGTADKKDTLFTGIDGLDDDHGVHAFVFGPDGRFYFNFGNAGKQILTKEGEPIMDPWGKEIKAHLDPFQQGMAFRCEEDGSNLEVLGYNFRNIYELVVDSYGNIFQSDNDDDGNRGVRINYIIEHGNYGYRDQITGAGWRERRVGMHKEIPMRHWHLNDPGVIPNLLQTGSGSPAGMAFNEGDLLPSNFSNMPIHAEPGHQVVRAYTTALDAYGFKAETRNILKSKDQWFRPSDVCIGPDGSLFAADWHDAIVGGNAMDDIQRGRILRIAPKVDRYKIPAYNFSKLDDAVKGLESPNQATRYLAWHAIRDAGKEGIEKLKIFLEDDNPRMVSRALWLLCSTKDQYDENIEIALSHSNENIRTAGIRIVRHLQRDALLDVLETMASDPAKQVRREVAVSLYGYCNDQSVSIWNKLVNQYEGNDRWFLEAIGLVSDACPDLYFQSWEDIHKNDWDNLVGREIIWRVHSRHAMPYLINIIQDQATPEMDLAKYFRAFHFIDAPGKNEILLDLLENHQGESQILKNVIGSLESHFIEVNPKAKRILTGLENKIEGEPEWFQLVNQLELDRRDQLWEMILDPANPEIQRLAATVLVSSTEGSWISDQFRKANRDTYSQLINLVGSTGSTQMIEIMKKELNRKDLNLVEKKAIVEVLGNSGTGQQFLYQSIQNQQLAEALILPAAVKLLTSWDKEIRTAAPAIIAGIQGEQALPDVVTLSRKTGEVSLGRRVFQTHCANCHQVDGEGIRFGPDLSEIGSKLSKRGLLQAIIYPSAGINFGYEGVLVMLENGDKIQGYIESETGDELLIRILSGSTMSIEKSKVTSQESLDISLMTEGLYKVMSEQELTGLVEYLNGLTRKD